MQAMPATSPLRFVRTRRTWQAYLSVSYFAFFINSLGALTPFLRDELGLSYTLASLHFSAFALGVIMIGLGLSAVVRRFGARRRPMYFTSIQFPTCA